MRYFLFINLIIILCSCSRPYRNMVAADSQESITAAHIRPQLDKILYRCEVNGRFLFKKFHLSGLLFLKLMPDSSTRIVFQNEMGLTYFDFGWNSRDSFQVNRIIDQMNKPALIRTLKKDFEILLVKNLDWQSPRLFADQTGNKIFRVNLNDGFAYYFFDQDEQHLLRIENADKRRKVTIFQFEQVPKINALPQQLLIRHLRAHFTIDLKKLDHDESP